MAKAKKTVEASGEAPAKKPASRGGAARSKGGKAAKPAGAPAAPQIDTALAAAAAAKLIAAKANAPSPAAGKESAAFANLKQSLNPSAATGMGNLIDKTVGPNQRKPNLPSFGGPNGGRQLGRNQTFGADVNRAGVPRRTGG